MRYVKTLLVFVIENFKSSMEHNSMRLNSQLKFRTFRCALVASVIGIPSLCLNYAFAENKEYPFLITKSAKINQDAKTKIIKGKVLDPSGVPIIGVNIIVKGSTVGTISDTDGNFTLDVPSDAIIRFSCIGYKNLEMPVDNKNIYNVTLSEENEEIEEIVVVGYGTQRKSDVVGTISVATEEDLLASPSFNALQGLKGKVAGVNIFSGTGNPLGNDDNPPKVVIRGMNSINTDSSPLYVVDGVQMNDIQFVNPNDIERMEVLKDASATAIYGARGANGVILVTTKRGDGAGHEGLAVSYNGYMSIATMARKMDVMNAEEFLKAEDIAFANLSKYPQGRKFLESMGVSEYKVDRSDPLIFDANGNPLYDTDWQDVGTHSPISHSHQLSIQSKGKKSSFGAFLNYTDQQALLINNYSKRISGKFTYDVKPFEWLEINSNFMVNHMWGNTIDNTGEGRLRVVQCGRCLLFCL